MPLCATDSARALPILFFVIGWTLPFRGLANRVYVVSVIHHEKIHQSQCKRLDGVFLREDRVRRYPERLH